MKTIYWDPNTDSSVQTARAEFDTMLASGHAAFYSKTETWKDPKKPDSEPIERPSGTLGEPMAEFDPAAGCAIFREIAS